MPVVTRPRLPGPLAQVAEQVGRLGQIGEGRRHRRSWTAAGKAHIEVRAVHRTGGDTVARDVERALARLGSVQWAEVNAVVGRVVVAFDPGELSLADLVEVVEGVEEAHQVHGERFPHTRPEHPGDAEPVRRALIGLGADVAGLGAGVFGQLLRATPFPVELASIVSLAENEPRVRRFLEHHVGVHATDIGLGLSNALVQSLTQGPMALMVDIVNRATTVGELRGARTAWEAREPELAPRHGRVPLEPVEPAPRPRSLRPGPVERYADGAALVSAAGVGVGLALTGSPRRAAAAITAGIPKAGRLGREAFAASVGRELARREVVVLDRTVLRRLDRIDVVVLDGPILVTGRSELVGAEALDGEDPAELQARAATLFDPERPDRVSRRGGWVLGPLVAVGVEPPRGAVARARALGRGRSVLGLARRDALVGLVAVDLELDPRAELLVDAARRDGRRLVVAGSGTVGSRLGVEEGCPGARRLVDSVRTLQEGGQGVLLVAGTGRHGALVAADCSVGITGGGPHPPWGADLVARRGLADAIFVVSALGAARQVSTRSAVMAAGGAVAGGALILAGPAGGAGRRAAIPVNAAALLAQASGTLTAAGLNRRPNPAPRTVTAWHAMGPDAVLEALGSGPGGLTGSEAARRQVRRVPEPSTLSKLGRAVGAELANPLTPVLAVGAGLAAAVGSATDAALVAGVTGANAVFGGIQRMRADVSIDRLLQTSTTLVGTRRDGLPLEVEPARLVRGDVVELRSGDVVPADCRLLECSSCEVDESVLTGESLPVGKAVAAVYGADLGDRSCMLYEGTTVVAGTALAVVVATGADTEVGRTLADAPEPPPSGVESRLTHLTAITVPATVASGAAVAGLSMLRGHSPRRAVGSGVSLMVAAVPEGLPLLANMAQLAAAHRLSTRGALVRNPRTIEALGRVDVLCFDKTGTLTAGRIALQRVSDGSTDEEVGALGPRARVVLATALRASPETEGDDLLPHATDQAVVDGALAAGVSVLDGPGAGAVASNGTRANGSGSNGHGPGGGWVPLGELAFESARGFHAVVGTGPGGARVSVKGAPEVILPRCTSWASPEGSVPLDRAVRRTLDAEVERLAGLGLRVLAVAERPASERPDLEAERVAGMELLGFLGLADLVRPTAAASVRGLQAAGVEVVMITGDHPSTARAVATELGILADRGTLAGRGVLTGRDIDTMGDGELDAVLDTVAVFARVTPTHKVRIVRAYQRVGRTVAMTGDGANDAPAIRLAHTGIALGGRGSTAARAAADLVVLDDRIETIIDAIVEGRAMWASVREALAILVGGNLGEVVFTVLATAISGTSPLGTRQLLLVNLLTDMLPAMTIALRPPDHRNPEALLHEGPEASLGAALVRQIGLRAATTAAGASGAWLVARGTGTRRRAGTVALAALVGTQLGQTALVGAGSPLVLVSSAASGAALVAVIQTPGVSQFFGCTPLGPVGWGIALGAAAVATGASVAVPAAAARFVPWIAGRLGPGPGTLVLPGGFGSLWPGGLDPEPPPFHGAETLRQPG